MKFYIKQGDTKPDFEKVLRDDQGRYIDLSEVDTIAFKMNEFYKGTGKIDSAATFTKADHEAVYEFQSGDTDTKGLYKAEFQLTYDDSSVRTIPQNTYYLIEVVEDLD